MIEPSNGPMELEFSPLIRCSGCRISLWCSDGSTCKVRPGMINEPGSILASDSTVLDSVCGRRYPSFPTGTLNPCTTYVDQSANFYGKLVRVKILTTLHIARNQITTVMTSISLEASCRITPSTVICFRKSTLI